MSPQQVDYLTPSQHLIRASMTLRGARPSLADIERVTSDPEQLDDVIDEYLDDPRFGTRVREMHNEHFLLQTDVDEQMPSVGLLEGVERGAIHEATTQAALRLIERVVVEDRPYTEIVTADWMLSNEVLAQIYGLAYDPEGDVWQESRWVDGRPTAGILSDAEMWRRHQSNGSNFHRGRANVISDQLLCESFATRDVIVEGGIDLSDEDAVAEAVLEMPTCVGCHQALDPMAGFFWGLEELALASGIRAAHDRDCRWSDDSPDLPPGQFPENYCYPLVLYQTFRENEWADWGLRPPGYFGQPGEGLVDLGQFIADDPRFSHCAARRFYSYLTQTPRDAVPFALATRLQGVLEDQDFSARALVRAIVLSDEFRSARSWVEEPPHHVPAVQTIRPEGYADLVEDLTGFRWEVNPEPGGCDECWGTVDLSTSDTFGFRALSGGVDSFSILTPVHLGTPVKMLVVERLALEGAAFAVREHGEVSLFSASAGTLSEPEDVRAEIRALHQKVLLVEPSESEIDGLQHLWEMGLGPTHDVEAAWILTLATLLQDPSLLQY